MVKITLLLNRYAPPVIWAVLIFFLSSYNTLPGSQIIWWDFIFKKSAHICMYAGLFFWIQRAINFDKTKTNYRLAFILTFLYALSDEYHQSFIIGRSSLPSDIGYDMLGASLVWLKLKDLV